MNNCIVIPVAAFCLAACAGTASLSDDTGVAQKAPVGADESAADDDVVQVAEIPTVPTAAVVVDRNERVCKNERKTGTNRVERICRTRAQIEQDRVESKEVFDDLHRSQQEY